MPPGAHGVLVVGHWSREEDDDREDGPHDGDDSDGELLRQPGS